MKLLRFLPFFIAPMILLAQNEFTLKPTLGMNGCQIHGDNYQGFDKFGLLLGASVNARLGKHSSAELGFYFSQKGSKHNPDHDNGDYTLYRVNLNYLDFPLSFRYEIKRYFITAGPSIAYLINYHEKNEMGDYTGQYPFKKYEVGVNLGLGINLNPAWSFEIRTSNSILPVRDWGGLTTKVNYDSWLAQMFNDGLYNNVISLFLAYKIGAETHGNEQQ